MTDWRLVDGEIRIVDPGGQRTATVDEIVDALAKTGPGDIRQQLNTIHFSRRSLEPFGVVRGRLPDDLSLHMAVARGEIIHVLKPNSSHCVLAGRWHPLEPNTLTALTHFTHKHDIAESASLSIGAYIALLADPTSGHLIRFEVEAAQDSDWLVAPSQSIPPAGLKATLYPYQVTGSAFLRSLASRNVGSLLGDEMGLGKTIQAIAVLMDQRHLGSSLVVAPSSLIVNWAREFGEFAPSLSVLIHRGPNRTGVIGTLTEPDIVLSSYETIVNDITFIKDMNWNLLVLDEAQRIRNPETARSIIMKSLKRRVGIAVTGTPVENRLVDLWSIGEFVVPSLLGALEQFQDAYPEEVQSAAALGAIMAPVTLRRKVRDVASDLPERVDILTALELEDPDPQRLATLQEQGSSLQTLTLQRLLCAHADDDADLDAMFETRPKVQHLLELMEEVFENGQKVLVFASFRKTFDRLSETTSRLFPEVFTAVVDGRVNPDKRQSLIDSFAGINGGAALFLNPSAAGVGLNITAANHVVHFNPEWNPAVTEQATARAHRKKQRLPVFVHHLYYASTVEEHAVELGRRKRELAKAVDEGHASHTIGKDPR